MYNIYTVVKNKKKVLNYGVTKEKAEQFVYEYQSAGIYAWYE